MGPLVYESGTMSTQRYRSCVYVWLWIDDRIPCCATVWPTPHDTIEWGVRDPSGTRKCRDDQKPSPLIDSSLPLSPYHTLLSYELVYNRCYGPFTQSHINRPTQIYSSSGFVNASDCTRTFVNSLSFSTCRMHHRCGSTVMRFTPSTA